MIPWLKPWSPDTVELKDLCFEYEAGENFELKDISFTLIHGKKLALVGPSGSGKTSLVNLILQFWDATGRYHFSEPGGFESN